MGKSHSWVWFHFCCKRTWNLVTLFTHLYVSMSVQLSCERRRAKARHWWNFTSIHHSLMLSLTHALTRSFSVFHSFLPLLIHSFSHSFSDQFVHLFTQFSVYLLIYFTESGIETSESSGSWQTNGSTWASKQTTSGVYWRFRERPCWQNGWAGNYNY